MSVLIALFVFITLFMLKLRLRLDLSEYNGFRFFIDFVYAFLGMIVFNHYFN